MHNPSQLPSFHVLANAVDIGETLLEWADESMGVYGGRFIPNDRYAEFKPIIRLYAEAVDWSGGEATDHVKLAEYKRRVSSLNPDAQPIMGAQITITDLIEKINEAEVEVFIDYPGLLDRYRDGRPVL